MHVNAFLVVGDDGLLGAVEYEAFALGSRAHLGDVVESEHHVLRRHGDRCAVGGVEDVVALEHEDLCLEDGLVGEREVYSHLVAVEVGIEGGTCQGVQLYGLALYHVWLEGLYAESVQRRCAVEQHGVSLHDVLEDVPDDGVFAIDDLLGRLDGLDDAALDELAYDERLVELGSHELGQSALAHVELGANDDDGTC